MSTVFRVVGTGKWLSLKRIKRLAKENGGSVRYHDRKEDRSENSRLLALPSGYLHLYKTGKKSWNEFERFGGNVEATDEWLATLFEEGIDCTSEYDDDFFTGRNR